MITQFDYTVLFILGKCLMDPEQIILIFAEVWHYNFHVSQQDFQEAGFFLQQLAISFSKKWNSAVFYSA